MIVNVKDVESNYLSKVKKNKAHVEIFHNVLNSI